MRADEFDKKLDEGEDVSQYLDISKARRSVQEQKRVNIDFPLWMIQLLDKEAKRLGVPRPVHHQTLGGRATEESILRLRFQPLAAPDRRETALASWRPPRWG
jgi:hypothetical protein